jgi:hypothetical protein
MSARYLMVILASAVLAACQTAGNTPPGATQKLLSQGFVYDSAATAKMQSSADANDIQTQAVYTCRPPACSEASVVGFGREPNPAESYAELVTFAGQSSQRGRRLVARLIGEGAGGAITNGAVNLFRTPDGARGLVFDGTIRGRVYIRMTLIATPTASRAVAAVSMDRGLARRFGGRDMLE